MMTSLKSSSGYSSISGRGAGGGDTLESVVGTFSLELTFSEMMREF